tara:strand:+ start:80 stop:343 length:264 start_codon:yes stop_codon:yes gene_type:complete
VTIQGKFASVRNQLAKNAFHFPILNSLVLQHQSNGVTMAKSKIGKKAGDKMKHNNLLAKKKKKEREATEKRQERIKEMNRLEQKKTE